jgi:hypothetical protein
VRNWPTVASHPTSEDKNVKKTNVKKTSIALACAFIVYGAPQLALADDDFYGIIESRPDGTAGTWVVGGRSVEATDQTRLDEEHGSLEVGACAEVDMEGKVVEDIESEPAHKCDK